MWKQAALAAAALALVGGCEDRTTRTTTNGRVAGRDTTTNRTTDTTRTTTPGAGIGDTTRSTPGATTTSPASLGGQDSEFVRKAASINLQEINASKLALERSQNNDVRGFAEMMGKDHADANDRLKDVATGLKADFPREVLPEHKAVEDRLKTLSGAPFDREFCSAMVDGHQKAVDLFQQQATSGQNDQLKAYAQTMLPKLRMHLDHATQLQKKIGSGTSEPATTPQEQPNPSEPVKPAEPGSSQPS
jgi:putative membrane protein